MIEFSSFNRQISTGSLKFFRLGFKNSKWWQLWRIDYKVKEPTNSWNFLLLFSVEFYVFLISNCNLDINILTRFSMNLLDFNKKITIFFIEITLKIVTGLDLRFGLNLLWTAEGQPGRHRPKSPRVSRQELTWQVVAGPRVTLGLVHRYKQARGSQVLSTDHWPLKVAKGCKQGCNPYLPALWCRP